MKNIFFLMLIGLNCFIYAQDAQQFPILKGDYLGQSLPGKKAVKFAPGIISIPNRPSILIVFAPNGNECYFTCQIGDSSKIYYSKRINNIWSKQIEAPFSLGKNVVLSSLSADGNTLFFEMNGIWKVERIKGGWGKPQLLPSPITSDDHSYYETKKGVAYFGSIRPGGLGKKMEIWCVSFKEGQYQKAENLGPIINCTKRNLTPCVALDESYLIYTQSDGTYEHLYISFNKGNNEWTKPVNMDINGENINIRFQNRPTLSPDGKYLFFNVHVPYGDSEIYWVSTEIIDDIKKEVFNSKLSPKEIHNAAAAGDLNTVRALIEADSTLLESKDNDGNTPLIKACMTLQLAVVNYLIDKGADINAKGMVGGTPLFFAIKNNDECFDLVQRLITKGADVNAKTSNTSRNWTILCKAVVAGNTGNIKVAKLLIDHGADLNVRDIQGTPLHMAINDSQNEEMAKMLIENGAKLQEFSYGNTELHLAAMKGFANLIPLLIKHGANVNDSNDYNHTALYYATKHGQRKTAEALIAAGASKDAIVETNYGKALQLTETLKEGEAYLWYLGGGSPCDGYAVKTKEHLVIINPSGIDNSSEAGLANGLLNPNELTEQKITVLINHKSDDRNAPGVSELAKAMPKANFVLNFKLSDSIAANLGTSAYRLAKPNESFSIGEIKIHTIPAMFQTFFDSESLGYLIEVDGIKIFHPGLHVSDNEASQLEKFRKEIDFLKPFGPIDIAIFPINGRHIWFAYEPFLYLIDQLSPKNIYLIGDDLATEEHLKCMEVLKARNVPVYFPEGGIAIGERFHYQRDKIM